MNSVELQKQLELVKKQEKEDSLRQEYENVRKEFEGKTYGSRSFEKDSKSASDSAIYIKSIYLGKGTFMGDELRILADIWQVRRTRHDGNYKFSRDNYLYNRSRNEETVLNNERNNANWTIWNMLPWSSVKVEISVEKFMSIWNAAMEHEAVISESFKKELGDTKELIKMGDSNKQTRIIEAINKISLSSEIIDVESLYPKLWEEIKYCDLPMFQDQKWLSKTYGRAILNYQIDLWQEELLKGWLSSRGRAYLERQIQVVKDHLIYF